MEVAVWQEQAPLAPASLRLLPVSLLHLAVSPAHKAKHSGRLRDTVVHQLQGTATPVHTPGFPACVARLGDPWSHDQTMTWSHEQMLLTEGVVLLQG